MYLLYVRVSAFAHLSKVKNWSESEVMLNWVVDQSRTSGDYVTCCCSTYTHCYLFVKSSTYMDEIWFSRLVVVVVVLSNFIYFLSVSLVMSGTSHGVMDFIGRRHLLYGIQWVDIEIDK